MNGLGAEHMAFECSYLPTTYAVWKRYLYSFASHRCNLCLAKDDVRKHVYIFYIYLKKNCIDIIIHDKNTFVRKRHVTKISKTLISGNLTLRLHSLNWQRKIKLGIDVKNIVK